MRGYGNILTKGIVLLLLPVAIAGCVNKKEPGRVTLTWVGAGGYEAQQLNEKIIKMFEAKHPHIKVILNMVPGEYYPKVMTMIAAGTPPDIMGIEEKEVEDWAKRGVLMELSSLIEKDKFSLSDYFLNVVDLFKYEGGAYGLPISFSTVILFYNKDLFDKAGVSYPDGTWTWETFLDAARKLTMDITGGRKVDQYGFIFGGWFNRWAIWVWQNNGEIMNDDFTRCMLNEPQAIEAMQFYGDLINKHHVSPTTAQMKERDWDDYFARGIAAMSTQGIWSIKAYNEIKTLRYDIAPLPRGKRKASCFIAGAYCILKDTKYPEEAWEFLKFSGGSEVQELQLKANAGIPAVKSVAYSPLFLNPEFPPVHKEVFLEAVSYSQIATLGPSLSEWGLWMDQTVDDIWAGRRNAKNVCEEIANKFNKILSSEETRYR